MQLFVPPSLLGAATAALTGVEFCRVSALPPSGEFTCGALRQRAGAERSVAVFRGAAIGDLPQLLSHARLDDLLLDGAEVDQQLAQPPALQFGALDLQCLTEGLRGDGAG
ncbi:MAG: hypothetical protein ACK5MO_05160, partial [Planctomyces sp.]